MTLGARAAFDDRGPMFLWCDGEHDAAENMRRDAALLERANADPAAIPVLRLFGFSPHGITLGHAQRPEQALDLDRCRADGVLAAVRPTGGRAIFHAEEWTYSLAARRDDPRWGGTLDEAYARASRLILASLVRLGVPARLTHGQRNAGDPASAACFASTARHEIVLDGRKLVGSAQRRTAHALLQQGSILLGPGHERLAEYLALPAEARAGARRRLSQDAANAGDHLGYDRRLARWASSLEEEIGPGVRRSDGDAGLILLTPVESGSYTAPSFS